MANKKVDALDFAEVMSDILLEYGDEAQKAALEALPTVAADTVSRLKDTSPRRTGHYAKSWAFTKQENGRLLRVYNRKYYRLTHLLEKGHLNRDGSRTRAQVHIAPAEEKAGRELEQTIKEQLNDIR